MGVSPPSSPITTPAPFSQLPLELVEAVVYSALHPDTVEVLASVNALAQACRRCFDIVDLILYRRYVQNAKQRALIWTARCEANPDTVRRITTLVPDTLKSSDITWAVVSECWEAFDLLIGLDHVCDALVAANGLDDNQDSTLCTAIRTNRHEMALGLISKDGLAVMGPEKDGKDPLMAAANKPDLARELLDYGITITVPEKPAKHLSAPDIAVEGRDMGMIRLLLEKGADPTRDEAAAILAASMGYPAILRLLLQHESIRDPSWLSWIAMVILQLEAVELKGVELLSDCLECIDILLGHRVDLAATFHGVSVQFGGWTPLHHRVEGGDIQVIQLLMSHGADPTAVSSDDRVPIADAMYLPRSGDSRIFRGQPQAGREPDVSW